MTFDLEEWWHANYGSYNYMDYRFKGRERIPVILPKILDALSFYSVKAEFFVLGETAKENSALLREISEEGHIISSHSMTHRLMHKLDNKSIRNEIETSKKMLEDLTGSSVTGFRAPCFSVSSKIRQYFFDCLIESGYEYDSSILSFRHRPLPDFPFMISGIAEYPVYSYSLGFWADLYPVEFSE
jgi:peptidoglycan/xylan/chitin deacetylase (PgdA/CDA1 family)